MLFQQEQRRLPMTQILGLILALGKKQGIDFFFLIFLEKTFILLLKSRVY